MPGGVLDVVIRVEKRTAKISCSYGPVILVGDTYNAMFSYLFICLLYVSKRSQLWDSLGEELPIQREQLIPRSQGVTFACIRNKKKETGIVHGKHFHALFANENLIF